MNIQAVFSLVTLFQHVNKFFFIFIFVFACQNLINTIFKLANYDSESAEQLFLKKHCTKLLQREIFYLWLINYLDSLERKLVLNDPSK